MTVIGVSGAGSGFLLSASQPGKFIHRYTALDAGSEPSSTDIRVYRGPLYFNTVYVLQYSLQDLIVFIIQSAQRFMRDGV